MKMLTNTSTAALVTAGAVLSAVMMVAAPRLCGDRLGQDRRGQLQQGTGRLPGRPHRAGSEDLPEGSGCGA